MLLGVLALSACGDDEMSPTQEPTGQLNGSPAELLTHWLERAFANQDSVLYEELLDEDYSGQYDLETFLEDSLRHIDRPPVVWTKRGDIDIIGCAFRAAWLDAITLNVFVEREEAKAWAGCPDCWEVETTVLVRIVGRTLEDDVFSYALEEPTLYVTRKDSADSTRWVIWRQFNSGVGVALPASGPAPVNPRSWGEIKQILGRCKSIGLR